MPLNPNSVSQRTSPRVANFLRMTPEYDHPRGAPQALPCSTQTLEHTRERRECENQCAAQFFIQIPHRAGHQSRNQSLPDSLALGNFSRRLIASSAGYDPFLSVPRIKHSGGRKEVNDHREIRSASIIYRISGTVSQIEKLQIVQK